MKHICLFNLRNRFLFFVLLSLSGSAFSQNEPPINQAQSEFWRKVQFGGGLGLAFGNGYTDISVAPSAIYNVNEIFAVGAGLQFSYANQKNYYNNIAYGVNGIVLVNPIPQIQLSVNLIQSRINVDFQETNFAPAFSDNYWATSMIAGAGYRTGNVTVGIGFTVFDTDPYNDSNPIIPFVRVYF